MNHSRFYSGISHCMCSHSKGCFFGFILKAEWPDFRQRMCLTLSGLKLFVMLNAASGWGPPPTHTLPIPSTGSDLRAGRQPLLEERELPFELVSDFWKQIYRLYVTGRQPWTLIQSSVNVVLSDNLKTQCPARAMQPCGALLQHFWTQRYTFGYLCSFSQCTGTTSNHFDQNPGSRFPLKTPFSLRMAATQPLYLSLCFGSP